MEIWKDIPGFKGQYSISNKGRVKSKNKYRTNYKNGKKYLLPERITTGRTDAYGYKVALLKLTDSTKCYDRKIHRLVAMAFIPNPDNKPEVNHKDGDKTNNNDWNLEWNTTKENQQHSTKLKPKGFPKRTEVLNTNTGIFYDTVKEAYESTPMLICRNVFQRKINGPRKNTTAFIKI